MSRYEVRPHEREGEKTYLLFDHAAKAEAELVPGIGNNLFRYQVQGQDLILPPPDFVMLRKWATRYGIPILSPPNRVKNATYSFNGRTYHLPKNFENDHIHGELAIRVWQVTKFGADEKQGAFVSSRFAYIDYPEILSYFPHALEFEFTYSLKSGKLHLKGTVTNHGADAAPYALGLHPYFPFSGSPAQDNQIALHIPTQSEWLITGDNLVGGLPPVPAKIPTPLTVGAFTPGQGYRLLTVSPGTSRIVAPDGNTITLKLDQHFPFIAVFRSEFERAISLEPYTYVTDAFNLPYPPELTGAKTLAAGESVSFNCAIFKK